jgi:hypothetical protein
MLGTLAEKPISRAGSVFEFKDQRLPFLVIKHAGYTLRAVLSNGQNNGCLAKMGFKMASPTMGYCRQGMKSPRRTLPDA